MLADNRQRDWESRLREALERQDRQALLQLLNEIHAADLADLFLELDEPEQIIVLEALSDEQAATLLDELDPRDQADVLDLITVERASDILEEMPSDEAADLLGELSTEEADALLGRMEPESADDVAELMRYAEDTAGGLMAKEFVRVEPEQTVAEVMTLLRAHHDDAEMIYNLFVLDEDDRLLGDVTLRTLIVSDPDAIMAAIMAREVISVPVEMPQEDVAELVRRHDIFALPVLDQEGRMLGIITVDDIGDVVQEEAAEDLLEMSGGEEEDAAVSPGWRGGRTGALAVAGGLICAGLIWQFAGTFSDWNDIALLLPLLLLLGITAGGLAALAMDRAVESTVERHQLARVFIRELLTGGMLALLSGLIAAAVIMILRTRHDAGLVALPLALGVWSSSIAGALGALSLRNRG